MPPDSTGPSAPDTVDTLLHRIRELQTTISISAAMALDVPGLSPTARRCIERMLQASRDMHSTVEQLPHAVRQQRSR